MHCQKKLEVLLSDSLDTSLNRRIVHMAKQFFFLLFLIMHSLLLASDSSNSNSSSSSSSSSESQERIFCFHSRRGTDNEFRPVLRFHYTPKALSETSGISLLGDIGKRNYRINGTYGRFFSDSLRMKISTEYLIQKIGYNFSSGEVKQWVQQTAGGIAYQYLFNDPWIFSADFSGYVAYSNGHFLSTLQCIDKKHIHRYIAGANTFGLSIGTTLTPWNFGLFKFLIDYDHVKYRRKYHRDYYVSGPGISFEWAQELICNLNFDFKIECRQPFNYCKFLINWNPSFCCTSEPIVQQGNWDLGFFWEYTHGKSKLPNVTTTGIQIGYNFNRKSQTISPCLEIPAYPNPQGSFTPFFDVANVIVAEKNALSNDLANWLYDPAIFFPIVLAIPDQHKRQPCFPPISFQIPPQTIAGIGPYILNVSSFFFSAFEEKLTFSATGLPQGSIIDPITGIIAGKNPADMSMSTVTITASTSCGSTSQTFTVLYLP